MQSKLIFCNARRDTEGRAHKLKILGIHRIYTLIICIHSPKPAWHYPLFHYGENLLNPLSELFRAYGGYIRHETFSFMMSHPAMSFGLGFCVSRKGRTGGGGWVQPKGANSMAASGLVFRSNLVGTGRAISILFGINGVRNKLSHLVGLHFQNSRPVFQLWQVGISLKT